MATRTTITTSAGRITAGARFLIVLWLAYWQRTGSAKTFSP